MQLYASPTSPFVRKINVAILELGIEDEIETVLAAGTPLAPGSLPITHNPLGKIPCLVRDDAPSIYDSRVIMNYLNDYAGGSLYPSRPRLWSCLTLEATADGILDAAVLMVYEVRLRPENLQFPDYIEAQWGKIDRALESLEHRWMSYLNGPMDAAHIAIACTLGYLTFRMPERNWGATRPVLKKWFEIFNERPSMQATQPKG